ncbi:MAG: 16S rRNA (guanine(527)-N(7))-methyltransferase RsmG [Sediminimonas qiaohouensis]|uniref:Ribosomal RNA small subunit methyltransferase G n=1 Tax=Sediminimonas qiaohouensis TaxID=552061 RepID=A0A7C9HAU5_9RHOB|nr:16S rRNA (guanine(527)-N(7))-methyltransferase RsmG [Sediminimonas qiaohouensis]MTJ04606.1 16S rRNA (guanine(527)-N(7))-methyltransferase RsmG [Sediminimonas qiaohouensis]
MSGDSLKGLGVSRETMDRLRILADLLEKWNPRINLVSKTTLGDLWERHIHDSAQLLRLCDSPANHWLDIGSGGGFPGLVIAAMSNEINAPRSVTLVESDIRKAEFLRTVVRQAGLNARVVAKRIEDVPPQEADIVSARALAPLGKLFELIERHMAPDAICLFPKGARWRAEVEAAQAAWAFDYEAIKSETDEDAVILKIGGLIRV